MAITQLQDIANQVAEGDYSSSGRLRNEEIRRRMYDDWSEPTDITESQTNTETSTPLVNVTAPSTGGTSPTMASTYSNLAKNYRTLGLDTITSGSGSNTNTENTTSGRMPVWAPTAGGTLASLMGAGKYAPLVSAAMNLTQGNVAGATGGLAATIASLLNTKNIPGLSGFAGTLASGLVGNKDVKDIAKDIGNTGIGTLISMTNPIAGLGYGVARMFGLDPIYGLNNLFGTGMQGVAPGFEGTLGGFFGKNAEGQGVSSTMNTTPTSLSTGTAGYTPPGYDGETSGTGITTGGYTGLQGGLSNTFVNSGPTTPSVNTNYGGYSPNMNSNSNSGSYGSGGNSMGGYSPTMNYGSNMGSYWSGGSTQTTDSGGE